MTRVIAVCVVQRIRREKYFTSFFCKSIRRQFRRFSLPLAGLFLRVLNMRTKQLGGMVCWKESGRRLNELAAAIRLIPVAMIP